MALGKTAHGQNSKAANQSLGRGRVWRHSRESLIRDVKRYAAGVKGRVAMVHFCRVTGVPVEAVYRSFPRGFIELLRAAGLEDRCARIGRVTKEDLLREMDRVAGEIGAMPDRGQLERMARYRITTYFGHIGAWGDVVRAYREWKGKGKSETARQRGRGEERGSETAS